MSGIYNRDQIPADLMPFFVRAEIGLEPTLPEFIAALVETFDLCRQVLADDGTAFVNMGDSYVSQSQSFLPITDVQAAWLAALIDGEGCIQIHRQERDGKAPNFQADVSVGQIDRGMVDRAHQITGLGAVHIREGRVFDWSVRGQEAATLLRRIYPHLVIKRRQAAAAIEVARHIDKSAFGRGRPVTEDAIAYRQTLRQVVSNANQRQPCSVGIPEPELHPTNLKPKDLIGQPWRLAFALQDAGWYLRQDIVWHKPNPMPESVRDRCTKAHEYIFLLSKSERYYFDAEAIKERAAGALAGNTKPTKGARAYEQGAAAHRTAAGLHQWAERQRSRRDSFKRDASKRASAAAPGQSTGTHRPDRAEAEWDTETRNKRSVWTVATEPYSGAHFATFPTRLIAPCILAGAPAGGIVLDPFFGSGTTGQVAQALGRRFIGIELNPAYKALQGERLAQAPKWAAL